MYEIYDKETGRYKTMTITGAALTACLDEDEVRWAIDEEGVCETDDHIIQIAPMVH